MNTYWISFAKGKNLGCCIVDAEDEAGAIARTKELGINPGGEAMLFRMDDSQDAKDEVTQWGKDVLISPEALRADNYRSTLEEEIHDKVYAHPDVRVVCEDCNEEPTE